MTTHLFTVWISRLTVSWRLFRPFVGRPYLFLLIVRSITSFFLFFFVFFLSFFFLYSNLSDWWAGFFLFGIVLCLLFIILTHCIFYIPFSISCFRILFSSPTIILEVETRVSQRGDSGIYRISSRQRRTASLFPPVQFMIDGSPSSRPYFPSLVGVTSRQRTIVSAGDHFVPGATLGCTATRATEDEFFRS